MTAPTDVAQSAPAGRQLAVGGLPGLPLAKEAAADGADASSAGFVRLLPGSGGEHALQVRQGTTARARQFYDQQVVVRLTEQMREFLGRTQMLMVATADGGGECDSSARFGPPGFIVVLDDTHVAYPDYRGNGVMASLGNISENPHVGLLALDLVIDLIGLHVNGHAHVIDDAELRTAHPDLPENHAAQCWVVVGVVEAYVQCRKHLPRMVPADQQCAEDTEDPPRPGGPDQFGAAGQQRSWVDSR